MKKLFIILSLISAPAMAADFTNLSTNTTSWDGQKIIYPTDGEPMVTAIKVELAPKQELPFHCHPFNTVGYVQTGELEVEKLNGEKQKFSKGQTIVEVANTWHRGINHSDTEKVELIGFYIGLKDKANTVMMTEENKDLCK
jgi:quercetin dioxygenase-like cupin family protein